MERDDLIEEDDFEDEKRLGCGCLRVPGNKPGTFHYVFCRAHQSVIDKSEDLERAQDDD